MAMTAVVHQPPHVVYASLALAYHKIQDSPHYDNGSHGNHCDGDAGIGRTSGMVCKTHSSMHERTGVATTAHAHAATSPYGTTAATPTATYCCSG